ncbi:MULTISPECIES: hypothetical protein [Pantoea]|uniref:Tum protein n=1 Tax=Pantoea piersonii TaxID=2364647 RepID=A0AAJ5U9V6_9GAMM|nr:MULTISPECIES: hypothetical protein [Pantoea]MDU6433536.1 hypothetical protein [Pantoea sp.]MBZ6387214.1 hypothetical protein [Pantoea piersonii]MBZ6402168.1 hypothetical protein [Pantoea piersonii]MBZ6409658.1 hypothetical protein [Pantoea piersonii]MBZ6426722.1 hypothetical protein [Pantoea piersonii]
MDTDLQEQVMLERVELIARLTTEGVCRERDREVALALIAEIAGDMMIKNKEFAVSFAAISTNK